MPVAKTLTKGETVRHLILVLLFIVILPARSWAYCYLPTMPVPPSPNDDPRKPYCDPTAGECRHNEVEAYRKDIEKDRLAWKKFLNDLENYTYDIERHAACRERELGQTFERWRATGI